MSAPIIGVTCSLATEPEHQRQRLYLNASYTDAIFAAGGIPQLLPLPKTIDRAVVDDIVSRIDGLLFTGGPDVPPRRYGQAAHAKTAPLDDRRDGFEFALFEAAEAARKPILAVCLGCQIANVVRGGCLIQHLPDAPRTTPIAHFREDGGSAFHLVQIDPKSRLAEIVGRTELEVNSRHHQALDPKEIGGHLRPVAFAPDGTVEAAEDADGHFMIAVQWHPEDLTDRAEHLGLFKALITESARTRASRRA